MGLIADSPMPLEQTALGNPFSLIIWFANWGGGEYKARKPKVAHVVG